MSGEPGRATSPPVLSLSLAEARDLALTAQGLRGGPFPLTPSTSPAAAPARRVAAVSDVLGRLGAVQLDTISVLARSHELVPYARIGAVGRDAVDAAYWAPDDPPATFEYWSHAACVLPLPLWPWFAFRRRWFQRRGERWHSVPTATLDALRRRLTEDGPLTTRDIGGAKTSSEWWDWSESKVGVEWLLDIGVVVCARRVGWRRVYDLADRVLPPEVTEPLPGVPWSDADGVEGPTDLACVRHLVRLGARAMGVGTLGDILDVHRLSTRYLTRAQLDTVVAELVDEGSLVPVRVAGWRGAAYADAELLAAGPSRGRHRTTLLSPFDSMIWHRGRTERVFGFEHLFEPYVPAARRQHGYFTMPVLHGGRLVARVDPKRDGRTLTARAVIFETSAGTGAPTGIVPASAVDGTARAIAEAARWVGCREVTVGDVRPATARGALTDQLVSRMSP